MSLLSTGLSTSELIATWPLGSSCEDELELWNVVLAGPPSELELELEKLLEEKETDS